MIAGATGYLGSYLVKESIKRNYSVKVITGNKNELIHPGLEADQIVSAEWMVPDTLHGCLTGIDVLISTIGITHQKDNFTYKANLNLLEEAFRAGVKK